MKAVVRERYGPPDVLELREVDRPVIGDDDVLVAVRAASVNPYDWHLMRGTPYLVRAQAGLLKPANTGMGADLAGQVEEVGRNVTRFRPGDEVFGAVSGAFAEYTRAPASKLVPKPANLTFEQAAAVPIAALTALQGLRDKGQVQSGQQVLINGAAGGVGTFAVQIAKSLGAEVTGVCSTRNSDLVRSLGAEHAIDYTREDFTRAEQRYDVILDAVGNRSLSDLRRVLRPDGFLVLAGAPKGLWLGPVVRPLKALLLSRIGSQKLVPFLATRKTEDLAVLKELLEAGTLTPVVDRRYPLGEIREAVTYLEDGHARGKVVITV